MFNQLVRTIAGHRTKYVIVLFWIVLAVVGGPLAGKLTGAEDNENSSFLPGNAESTKVLDQQAPFSSPNALPALVVYARDGGLTAADRAAATADVKVFARGEGVDGAVRGPVPSKDGAVLETVVPIALGTNGFMRAPDIADAMARQARSHSTGLKAYVAGPLGNAADQSRAFEGIDGKLLYGTIGVVVLILLLTYRSPLLWLLPVLSAGTALVVGEAVIYLLADHAGLTVNAQSAGILTVLVFGAGTDYALLLVARYREELRRHDDRHEAMAVALHRAGPAVLASGGTVILGMLCLLTASVASTQGLGPVAAVGIAVALLVMLTLLPALLVVFGRWIFWPARPLMGSVEPTADGFWARVGRRIRPRPRLVWIVTALILAALSTGISTLDAHGLSTADSFRNEPDSVVGQKLLAAHGLVSSGGDPVVVLTSASTATRVRQVLAGDPDLVAATVSKPVVRQGRAYLTAALTTAPDSAAASSAITDLRTKVRAVPGAGALVGGDTAITLDVENASHRDNTVIIPLVLIVVLLVLSLLLRAIVAPLVLIATVVLSFGAALGASALLFRYAFGFHGADTALPLFVFVFLVALGIDYNIFLMTRVREETAAKGAREGALIGLGATGGVITSAGLVLSGTFLVLSTLPIVAFAEIGVAVALGVLMDTLVVRSVLVTALNLDIGAPMWWPSRLARPVTERPHARHRSSFGA